jgi:hypothetical protein
MIHEPGLGLVRVFIFYNTCITYGLKGSTEGW